MSKTEGFRPIKLLEAPVGEVGSAKTTVTCTLKGSAAEEFETLCNANGLSKSQLLTQMVYHCLNKSDNLKDLYRRLAILA